MDFNKMTKEERVVYVAIKDNLPLDEYWEAKYRDWETDRKSVV